MKTEKKKPEQKRNLRGAELPEGVTLEMLRDNRSVAAVEYQPVFARARKLDAADSGDLWKAVQAKFPSYQILPDTNYVSYVKDNIVAAIYTVGKCAHLLPTSEDDKEIVEHLNVALEHIWNSVDVPKYQLQAGERAALMNFGLTQVGWDGEVTVGNGTNKLCKGEVALKNINPLQFMRDPFAESLDTAGYCMTWEHYHKSAILGTEQYKEEFKRYRAAVDAGIGSIHVQGIEPIRDTNAPIGKKDYYTVITHWVNVDGKIHEIHTLADEWVLFVREAIKPAMFPFAELYCNEPANRLFGISSPQKIFKNNLTYNIMSSIICTSEYKNQRPPRFVNSQSGLNVATFTRNGNDADRTFVVNGDADKAVHYHQFPQMSQQAFAVMGTLGADIQTISGVDGSYTGRDTGSILTTGGIDSMLDQATMIDAPKVTNYERYCKRLTQLIIGNYVNHANMKREYFVKDPANNEWKSVEVSFGDINSDTVFDYEMQLSSILPKNKARLENFANKVMEMQMQYKAAGIDVDLITPEEWLMFQDNPYREYMQKRMGVQRSQNYQDMVAKVIGHYADLTELGVAPVDAVNMTAQGIAQENMDGKPGALQEQIDTLSSMQPAAVEQTMMPDIAAMM